MLGDVHIAMVSDIPAVGSSRESELLRRGQSRCGRRLVGILAAAGACIPVALHAQVPPGAGHGFLIDKHIAANLKCTSCHKTTRSQPPTTATCLACHGKTYDALAVQSAGSVPNPHQSHEGEVPCAACHHVHTASENPCAQCHPGFAFKVP